MCGSCVHARVYVTNARVYTTLAARMCRQGRLSFLGKKVNVTNVDIYNSRIPALPVKSRERMRRDEALVSPSGSC